MKIEGVEKVLRLLDRKVTRLLGSREKGVVVGFTAAYALYVHENMEIWPPGMRLKGKPRKPPGKGLYWDPQGIAGPKFLEGPARELSNSGELSRILTAAVGQGKTVLQGLLLCGLRIQRESQQRTPVDTGNLKASAFTRVE